jgi:hypothetical protein
VAYHPQVGFRMNDYVGFEPNRLDQLSKRLQGVARSLDANLQRISSIVASAGGSVSGSSRIGHWVAEAENDANDMTYRSQRAWELYRQRMKNPFMVGPASPQVLVNWVETSEGGRQAAQDAKGFNSALGNTAPKSSRQELKSLAQSLRDHARDKDYLKTFWNQVDPSMASRLARLLHNQDMANGAPKSGNYALSGESRAILRNVATGLVALHDNKLAIPDPVRNALVNPTGDDIWSSVMLAKFGPAGNRWDPNLLADLARREIYRSDERGIYHDLDPMRAILAKLAESHVASRLLLGNKTNGTNDTLMLLRTAAEYEKEHFAHAPGIGDVAGNVMVAATQTSRGKSADAHDSGQAFANIISATHEWIALALKSALHLELPEGVRNGMTRVAGLYLPDLANSSTNSQKDGSSAVRSADGEPWNVFSTHDLVKEFLGEALKDPRDFGWLKGKARAYISASTALSAMGGDDRIYAATSASFLGLLRSVDNDQQITKGHEKDADASARQSTLDTLNSLISLIPGEKLGALAVSAGVNAAAGSKISAVPGQVGNAKTLADLFMNPSGGAEAQAQVDAIRDTAREKFSINALIVEGLIKAGKIPEPTDQAVYRFGHVVPGSDFQYWYNNHAGMDITIGGDKAGKSQRRSLDDYVTQLTQKYGDLANWI